MLTTVALAAVLAATAAPARADGDPASDILISGRVFVGSSAPESTPEVRELLALTAESGRKGFPVRVAVIREVTDLGAVPTLFGASQRYATFLGQELRFVYRGTLVVVMGGKPGGVGVFGPGATPVARTAVRGITVPEAGNADELARIASTAVRRVAAANGHVLTTPRAASSESSQTLVFLATGAALAVAVLTALGLLWRRRKTR